MVVTLKESNQHSGASVQGVLRTEAFAFLSSKCKHFPWPEQAALLEVHRLAATQLPYATESGSPLRRLFCEGHLWKEPSFLNSASDGGVLLSYEWKFSFEFFAAVRCLFKALILFRSFPADFGLPNWQLLVLQHYLSRKRERQVFKDNCLGSLNFPPALPSIALRITPAVVVIG